MPRALVVGPNSMLGSRLSERLRELGWDVVGVGRRAECDVHLDLGSAELYLDYPVLKADVLFHCASAFGDDSPEGAWLNERVNVLGSHQVLALARAAGCRQVIYAGSVSSTAQAPDLGSYGASKARAEQILAWGLEREGLGFASLRLAQLYDERGECVNHQRWFGRIVSYARTGRTLRLPPGEALRNFVHVRDAVAALVLAADQELRGVTHLCHPEGHSYLSIARQAFEVFGSGGDVVIAPEKVPFRHTFFPVLSPEFSSLRFTSLLEGLRGIRDGGHAQRFEVFDVH
ncbi:NAD-dependent epimerase/dehydratase family protein [Pseudomonas sp. OTU5201]|uniref:NAD-dependent epimerase/dehydratase family protein n=1 Tax=Pseudomonas sp. OTU5201 TaxID=3043850 RepID=UPI00313D0A54